MSRLKENDGHEKHSGRPVTRGRPSSQKTQRLLAEFSKDLHYLAAHYEDLLGHYENQWVAISKEQIIAADTDPERLIAEVDRQGAIGRALIEYLTREEPFFLRPS